MTEEIRPICLYVETCLDRKEGTRNCAKCEHHLNYWTEVMIRDMAKNITRLEQENKELKEDLKSQQMINLKQQEIALDYWNALEEIRNNFMCFRSCMMPFHVSNKENLPHKMADAIQNYCESIINKINEVLQ